MGTQISLEDLEEALLWTEAGSGGETRAWFCRTSGCLYTGGHDDPDIDELPSDIEDADRYAEVPDKRDLDLGQSLVFRFVLAHAPQLESDVEAIFSRRGAYRRFKDLLERHDLLQRWYDFENRATCVALLEWAESEGFEVDCGDAAATVAVSSAAPKGRFNNLIPKIFYSQLADGLAFFVDVLGFEVAWQDASLAVVERDGAKAYLMENAELAALDRPELAIETDDIEAVHAEMSARAPERLHPNLARVQLRPWGAREFAMLDPSTVCVVFREWPAMP
jgi:hypothetical protein